MTARWDRRGVICLVRRQARGAASSCKPRTSEYLSHRSRMLGTRVSQSEHNTAWSYLYQRYPRRPASSLGMVAGIKSERWPASLRKRWPACVGIRISAVTSRSLQGGIGGTGGTTRENEPAGRYRAGDRVVPDRCWLRLGTGTTLYHLPVPPQIEIPLRVPLGTTGTPSRRTAPETTMRRHWRATAR